MLFTVFIFSFFTEAKINYSQKLHELCMQRFPRTVDTRKFTCDCEIRNLNIKSNEKDLKFFYEHLKGNKTSAKLTDNQNMMLEFAFNISEECVKDHKWTMERP